MRSVKTYYTIRKNKNRIVYNKFEQSIIKTKYNKVTKIL